MQINRWKWAYCLLGGALAWFLHLLVTYSVGEWSCLLEGTFFQFLTFTSAGWFLFVFSLFCAVAASGAIWTGYRLPQQLDGPNSYIRRFAMTSNSIFLVGIIAQTLPVFYLSKGC